MKFSLCLKKKEYYKLRRFIILTRFCYHREQSNIEIMLFVHNLEREYYYYYSDRRFDFNNLMDQLDSKIPSSGISSFTELKKILYTIKIPLFNSLIPHCPDNNYVYTLFMVDDFLEKEYKQILKSTNRSGTSYKKHERSMPKIEDFWKDLADAKYSKQLFNLLSNNKITIKKNRFLWLYNLDNKKVNGNYETDSKEIMSCIEELGLMHFTVSPINGKRYIARVKIPYSEIEDKINKPTVWHSYAYSVFRTGMRNDNFWGRSVCLNSFRDSYPEAVISNKLYANSFQISQAGVINRSARQIDEEQLKELYKYSRENM